MTPSHLSEPAPVAAWAQVDRSALADNHRTLAGWRPGVEVAAVIKCDGYGLGMAAVARALFEGGCRTFFVANAREGAVLRKATLPYGRDLIIYAFDGPAHGWEGLLWDADVRPVLNSEDQIARWRAYAAGRTGGPSAALHIDTGMNRLGVRPEDVEEIDKRGALDFALLMTHFACSETEATMNAAQVARFDAARDRFPATPISLSNSEAFIGGLAPHENVARVGLAHFGARLGSRPGPALRPAAALHAPIVQIRHVAAGETIGYGAASCVWDDSCVAIAAAGYGDGLPRNDVAAGAAFIGEGTVPILGRVSMDLTALDISALAPGRVKVGDQVEFFGPRRPIDIAAADFKRTPYELLTGLTPRVERRSIERAS